MPDGAVVSASRYVSPGNLGGAGKGLLRVRVDGESLDSPLYLITSAGSVAGTGSVVAGRASIRADVADCTGAAPCRLALTPAGDLLTSELGISASSMLSGAAAVVLSDAATSEVSLVLEPRRSLVVSLLAVNPDGRMAWADDVASVCLYLESEVAGSLLRQPACNDVDPARVTWTSLSTEFGAVPLPKEAALSVLTDPSEGPCTAPGQLGWSGSWSEAAVCSGWTWGSFTGLRPGITGLGDDVGSSVVIGDVAESHYTAVWESATTTSLALPATGWNGDPLWENPRDVPSCASSSSCTPPTSSPEAACPGDHCNHTGGTAPVLTAPVSGVYKRASVEVSASASTSFDLLFADNDGGDGLVVTVVESPVWLSSGGDGLVAAMTLYDGAAGSASVTLTADAPSATPAALVLEISDGENQRTVTVIVGTDLAGVPAFLLTGPVTLTQAATATSRVLGVDALGEPLAALDVAVTAPEGVLVSSPVSGGDGWFTYSFSAPTAPAGSGVLTLTGGFANTEEVFVVAPTPGLVAVSLAAVDQGGSTPVTFTVTDRAGDPQEDAHAWGTLSTTAGPWPLGLRLDPRGCLTDATGTCEVMLLAADSAVTGAFTVTGSAGDVFSSTAGDVDPSIFSLSSSELSIEQGGTGALSFTVFDGRGEPLVSETVSLATTASGVTIPGSVTTDISGSASVEITVSSSALPGATSLTLTGGAGVLTTGFEVTSTISDVEAPAVAVRVAQRGTNTVTVVATDPQGDPVSGRLLDIATPVGLYAPASVYTLADGSATFNVVAAEDRALGAAELTVSYDGTALATVPLTVAAGIATLETYGELVTSAPATVSVIAKNSVGLPLSGRSVVLESKDSRISVPAAAVVTNLTGAASFTVTSGRIPAGTYRFIARVDGREIPIEVVRP
jgi:hypothetical protein